MSCQLTLRALFEDIKAVKKYIYPNINEEVLFDERQDDSEGWDDSDWGWKNDDDDEDEDMEDTSKTGNSSWLQECIVSISPVGDLMAIGRGDRLVILSRNWDCQEQDVPIQYRVTVESRLSQEENEMITAILCLPLASQKRSMQGGPDWTCVIVGFSSGYVRIYTETGALLLSQIFNEVPVQQIKCRTYQPPRHPGDVERHEELNILYKRSLVTIDGFSFFQSLRACRNQVARAAACGSELMQPPPLAYKKWALHDQDCIVDHTACGLLTSNPFDQMHTASLLGGYTATMRSTMPASYLYVTTGAGPYLDFFYAVEGSTQPMLSDVAHAVASKLKSALFSAASGWLSFGNKQAQDYSREKRRPKIEPPTTLPCRYGLHDLRRQGESVSLSPDSRLAACTDSFGRVMLIDVQRGIAIRMWKGYRDAQVGWVEVTEDPCVEHTAQTILRHASFLIIYAPRRGILEVWTSQQGPRVAAFNVSKWCHLVFVEHGIMALNNVTYCNVDMSRYPVYLLDPDGSVKTVDIPFHLALSDKNSKRARDMHLLKKLKLSLKDNIGEADVLVKDVIDILSEIKFASIRQQGLERVLMTSYMSAASLKTIITAMSDQLTSPGVSSEGTSVGCDYESRVLSHFCQSRLSLLDTYTHLSMLTPDSGSPRDADDDETMSTRLLLTVDELQDLRERFAHYETLFDGDERNVSFAEDQQPLDVVRFLACFECHMLRDGGLLPSLHAQLSDARSLQLANFVFGHCLENGTSVDYNTLLSASHLPAQHLITLLMRLWLSNEKRTFKQAVNLHDIIMTISSLKDFHDVVSENSPWWTQLRATCAEADNVSAALLAALVGRSVAMEMAKKAFNGSMETSDSESTIDMSDWESVSMDRANWTLLVRQLDDLFALSCLLAMRPPTQASTAKSERITVSVKKVLKGGRGVLSEFVAKWIAHHAIPVSMLCLQEGSQSEDKLQHSDAQSLRPLIAQLQLVQNRFPHSLDLDVLLANSSWENMILWNKDPEVVFPLEQAVAYLRCLQNAKLQQGVATMMWQMFIIKRLSAAAFLMEKVGKAPKDRLCRKEVGLGEEAMKNFIGCTVELLSVMIQSEKTPHEVPVVHTEDPWQSIGGPTSLVELAVEQKQTNSPLVRHHYHLCTVLHAILCLSMKSVKPLSLFNTKATSALFQPLQSSASLSTSGVDDVLATSRKQFLCRVITECVIRLKAADTKSIHGQLPAAFYVAHYLHVDVDELRQHQITELYSSNCDKLADEVLLMVNDATEMGYKLLNIVGCRLAHFIFICDPPESVSKLSRCSPAISTWLKTMNPHDLRQPNASLKDTAALIAHVVSLLPESHPQYTLAIELVELINTLM